MATNEFDGRGFLEALEELWRDVPTPPGAHGLGEPVRMIAPDGEVSYLSFERLGEAVPLDATFRRPPGPREWDGLLRLSADRSKFERADRGKWVEDRDLYRHFAYVGADGPELIDRETAEQLAARYGVEL